MFGSVQGGEEKGHKRRINFGSKEKRRVRCKQMDNLKGLLGISKMDRVPNARIRELCGVTKGVDERIDEGVLQLFGQVERMERDRITKRVYV